VNNKVTLLFVIIVIVCLLSLGQIHRNKRERCDKYESYLAACTAELRKCKEAHIPAREDGHDAAIKALHNVRNMVDDMVNNCKQ
jgi:hypothetical protein